MAGSAIKETLINSLRSWTRSDTALLWGWALCVAGAVTFYEVYYNAESQHPSKFWTDRVPTYFTVTLVFTGVTFAVSRLSPHLKGWLGILVTSAALSVLFAVVVPGMSDWSGRLLLGRNLVVMTTLYLVPPFLLATILRWSERRAD